MFGLFEKKCVQCSEKITDKPVKAYTGREFCSGSCVENFGKTYQPGKGGCCG